MTSRIPLITNREWEAKALTSSGNVIETKIYKSAFYNKSPFIHVGVEWYSNYSGWFTVNNFGAQTIVSRVSLVRKFPYLNSSHSPQKIDITSAKIEQQWHVIYSGQSVLFSNEFISVSVKPKGGQWLDELEKSGAPVTRKSTLVNR